MRLGCSLGVGQDDEKTIQTMPEPQPLVELDRPRVIGPGMQERGFAAIEDAPHHAGCEQRGITLAGMVGMRADRAYLGIARHFHALSRHGHEPSFAPYAEKTAQLVSAGTEGTGLRELGKLNHRR